MTNVVEKRGRRAVFGGSDKKTARACDGLARHVTIRRNEWPEDVARAKASSIQSSYRIICHAQSIGALR